MSFVYPHISPIAILVGAVAQFVLGWLWYSNASPMGRRWMAEMAIVPQADQRPGMEMLAFPVGSIIAAWAVAMVFAWSGAVGPVEGILAAWIVALAVGAQTVMQRVASGKRSSALLVIDLLYIAVGYALVGVIVGLLG